MCNQEICGRFANLNGISEIHYKRNVYSVPKISLHIRASENYLPESPYFKESLAGVSGLVLMSVPVLSSNAAGLVFTNKVNDYEDVLLGDQGSTVPGQPR